MEHLPKPKLSEEEMARERKAATRRKVTEEQEALGEQALRNPALGQRLEELGVTGGDVERAQEGRERSDAERLRRMKSKEAGN